MRFGCCTSLENMGKVQESGYDFFEMSIPTVMPESPESEYAPVRDKINSFDIKPEVWNVLLSGGTKVTGPEVDLYRTERYLRTAFRRVAELGGKVIVFGSGEARKIPEGWLEMEAKKQILEFFALLGQIAQENGITVAVEPLNKKETNIINSVAEGMDYIEAVNHPNIKVLVDSYHVAEANEPLSDISDAGISIVHVHTSDTGRLAPGIHAYGSKELIDSLDGKPAYDYQTFFKALREIGYDARISVECRFNDFDTESAKALEYLKSEWTRSK